MTKSKFLGYLFTDQFQICNSLNFLYKPQRILILLVESSRLAGEYSKNVFKFCGKWEKQDADSQKISWKVKKIDILIKNRPADGFFSQNMSSGIVMFQRFWEMQKLYVCRYLFITNKFLVKN